MGWKLGLALRQFLPSPEAPVVLILIIVVDVEIADINRFAIDVARFEMARDELTEGRLTRKNSGVKTNSL